MARELRYKGFVFVYVFFKDNERITVTSEFRIVLFTKMREILS